VISIFTGAKEIVAEGWCQGNYCNVIHGRRCFCAVGAMITASRRLGEDVDETDKALQALTGHAQATRGMTTVAFNDTPGRKVEEIIQLFDELIAKGE